VKNCGNCVYWGGGQFIHEVGICVKSPELDGDLISYVHKARNDSCSQHKRTEPKKGKVRLYI
jgi:hypothetical protein